MTTEPAMILVLFQRTPAGLELVDQPEADDEDVPVVPMILPEPYLPLSA